MIIPVNIFILAFLDMISEIYCKDWLGIESNAYKFAMIIGVIAILLCNVYVFLSKQKQQKSRTIIRWIVFILIVSSILILFLDLIW